MGLQVDRAVPQGQLLAAVFETLSETVKNGAGIDSAEKALQELDLRYKEMPLPRSRDEFELRSAVLQLDRELMLYFSIANRSSPLKFNPSTTRSPGRHPEV